MENSLNAANTREIPASGKVKPEKSKNQHVREAVSAYLFLAPWLIGLLALFIGPALFSVWLSLCKWNLVSPPSYVGLRNYLLLMDDPLFIKSIQVTVRYVLINVSLSMVLSLLLAQLLSTTNAVMYIFRVIFYLPSVISGVAVGILWKWIFAPDFGFMAYFLSVFGINSPQWLSDPTYAPWALQIVCLTYIGGTMVIFIAGIQNIPAYMYEAATIDGANRFQQFRRITLPILSPIILFNLITMFIGAFRVFTQVYAISSSNMGSDGYPANSLLVYVMYLYKKAFTMMDMGGAAAMAWVFFIGILTMTGLLFLVTKRFVYYESERQ